MRSFKLSMCWILGIFVLGVGAFDGEAAEPMRPNVVIVFIDDQGYYDLGCYGANRVKTPRIDALADQGLRLTDYYAAAPICSPSRAGLLTGCYPRRNGLEVWVQRADSKRGIPTEELTLAELFQDNGYATACIGKWHLGDEPSSLPRAQGFDSYFGLLHNLDPIEVSYFPDQAVPLLRNGEVVKESADPNELTRLYTEEAIRFVQANQERPFFLYLAHTMLHMPLGVGKEFRGSSSWGEYGDAIQEMDHYVGRLVDALNALPGDRPSIVVYASDNGRGPGRNANQPMKGHKLTTWECGIRVPAIIWGPQAGIASGRVSTEVVHAMDWYPTLSSLAGITIPERKIVDGRDLSPLVLGKTETIPPAGQYDSRNNAAVLRRAWDQPGEWQPHFTRQEYLNAFFYHGSEGQLSAVRSGKHKLFLNPALTLYDLSTDPGETSPVRDRDALRKLRGMAVMFQEEMNRQSQSRK